MKKTYLIIVLQVLVSSLLFAQDPIPDPIPDPTPSTYQDVSGWYVELGQRTFEIDEGVLNFTYIDESPSQDFIVEQLDLKSRTVYDLGVGLITDFDRRLVKFGLRGVLGKVNGLGVDLGLGYYLVQKKAFFCRATGLMSFGAMGMRLGEIENNALFVQVNDTQFYDDEVSVRVRSFFIGFKPSLEIGTTADFLPRIQALSFEIGYNLTGALGTELKFEGTDENDDLTTDFEDIDAQNVAFQVNGSDVDSLPIQYSGIYFGVTAVF